MSRCCYILLLLLSIVGLSTCRTAVEGYRAVQLVADQRPAAQRVKSIADRQVDWQTFSAKGRFAIAGGEEMLASMQMRMVRDRYILISLRGGMGIEGGRIFITPDSLYIIDKINKCYVADVPAVFTAGLPVSLGNLQDVLLCRTFATGNEARVGEVDEYGDFSTSIIADDGATFSFSFDCFNLLDAMVAVRSDGLASCSTGYDDYIETDFGIVATSLSIISRSRDYRINMQAEYSPSSIMWNKQVDDKLSIPSGYSRIEAYALLQQFNSKFY